MLRLVSTRQGSGKVTKMYAIRLSMVGGTPGGVMSDVLSEYLPAKSALEALTIAMNELTDDEKASIESVCCELIGKKTTGKER